MFVVDIFPSFTLFSHFSLLLLLVALFLFFHKQHFFFIFLNVFVYIRSSISSSSSYIFHFFSTRRRLFTKECEIECNFESNVWLATQFFIIALVAAADANQLFVDDYGFLYFSTSFDEIREEKNLIFIFSMSHVTPLK